MNRFPVDNQSLRPSDKYCVGALLCLSLAIFTLSVLEFLVNPSTPFGMVIACIGVLWMCGSIFFFIRYSFRLKEEEKGHS